MIKLSINKADMDEAVMYQAGVSACEACMDKAGVDEAGIN